MQQYQFKITLGIALLFSCQVVFSYTAVTAEKEPKNESYVLMDYESGRVLAGNNINKQLPPASLTKLMTSFIVERQLLEGNIKEQDQVKMRPEYQCKFEKSESCSFLVPNKKYSVLDLLRGVIIQSGNDASVALANYLGGSEKAFINLMNHQAKQLGLKNTNYMNVTGLDQPEHYSSAFDLALLSRYIISENKRYYPLYSEKNFSLNNIPQNNRNALLYIDPSVDGLKTGHTRNAGYSLAGSIKRANLRLIVVIEGAPSANARAKQARELFKWGFENYEASLLKKQGDIVGTANIKGGTVPEVDVALKSNLYITTAKNQPLPEINSELRLFSNINAPVQQGQILGHLNTYNKAHQLLASEPVIASKNIPKATVTEGFMKKLGFGS